ncbi:hypothetical protein D3C72_1269790 [compost metagenome]
MWIPFNHNVRIQGQPDGAIRRRFAATELQHLLLPFLVGRRTGLLQAAVHAHRLHAVILAEFPAQVVAGDEAAQARVEWLDVIILEVDLDKGLPVVVALVDFHVVEHIAGKIEVFRDGQIFQFFHHVVTVLLEQQAIPALQRRFRQVQARCLGEMRRADQFTLEVVGPAVQRADDMVRVAAAVVHQRLPVAAHVGQHFDAVGVAHEHAPLVLRRQGRKIAGFRHHQRMPDIARAGLEQLLHFTLQQRFVKIDVDRKLRV